MLFDHLAWEFFVLYQYIVFNTLSRKLNTLDSHINHEADEHEVEGAKGQRLSINFLAHLVFPSQALGEFERVGRKIAAEIGDKFYTLTKAHHRKQTTVDIYKTCT